LDLLDFWLRIQCCLRKGCQEVWQGPEEYLQGQQQGKEGALEVYTINIYKVQKQVHFHTSVSSNSFVKEIFERIAAESSRLANHDKSSVSSREIQTTFCSSSSPVRLLSTLSLQAPRPSPSTPINFYKQHFKLFSGILICYLEIQIGNHKFNRGTTYFIEYKKDYMQFSNFISIILLSDT